MIANNFLWDQSAFYYLKNYPICFFRDGDEVHHHHWQTGYGTGGGDGPRLANIFFVQ